MTIGLQWLPSLGVPPRAQFPLAAAGTFTGNSFSTPQTFTLPNSYSTAVGDCIIVAYTLAGSPTPVFSGCGATWTRYSVATNCSAGIAVGYNCSASGTSITMTGGAAQGDVVVSVWKQVLASGNPVTSTQSATGSVGTLTSPSLTYSAGQLLVAGGGGCGAGDGITATSWSNGTTNTNVAKSATNRGVSLDYVIPVGGTSTTVTDTFAISSGSANRIIVAALSHA